MGGREGADERIGIDLLSDVDRGVESRVLDDDHLSPWNIASSDQSSKTSARIRHLDTGHLEVCEGKSLRVRGRERDGGGHGWGRRTFW